MDFRNVLIGLITIANLLILLLVHFRSPRLTSIRFFKLATIAVFLWCLSMVMYRYFSIENNIEYAVFWARMLYAVASIIPLAFVLHALTFPNDRIKTKMIIPLLLVGGIYFMINLLSSFIVESVDLSTVGEKSIIFASFYYFSFPLYISSLFFLAYVIYFRKLNHVTGIYRYQLRLIFVGLLISSFVAMVSNLILPTFGYFNLNWLGQVMTTVWIIVIGYAIIKHRFVDFKLVVIRSLSYVLSLSFVVMGLGLLIIALTDQLFNTARSGTEVLFLVSLISLAIVLFQPIKSGFDSITQSLFHSGSYDIKDIFQEITLAISTHLNISELSKSISKVFLEKMKTKKSSILILDEKSKQIWSDGKLKVETEQMDGLIDLFASKSARARENILVMDEMLDEKLLNAMMTFNAEIIVGLSFREKIIGLLLLSEKSSGTHYSEDDLKTIAIVGPELGIALANSMAYEEIRNFNITLKEEVEHATKKLKAANARLLQLDKLKDEFVSLASHELRTPMVSIRNYTWMLLNGKAGPLKPKQKEYIHRVYESGTRLSRLVNSMLNISRIESGRIILNVERADIYEVVKSVLTEIEGKAKSQSIKIVVEKSIKDLKTKRELEKPPSVLIDIDKIKEVIINLVGNSMKFTKPGGKIIVSFAVDELYVHVRVKDDGIGLTEEEIPQLFKKFGMIKETYLMTTGTVQGTGLGLYICKSIIDMHGGSIGVMSEGRQKGSTFSFTVPREASPVASKIQRGDSESKDAGIIHTELNGY